jgi:hypothetical protein
MAQKIYFGDVIIKNTNTGHSETIEGLVFREFEELTDNFLRSTALRKFKKPDREQYQIEKLCFDTAKYLGVTVY